MLPGVDIGGAGQRLLPEHIPLRFFGSAVAFHVLAWIGLVVTADDLPGFYGGPGPVLASTHALTLGVLLMTAMGASLQMLPVALGRAAPAVSACRAVFAAFAPGCLLLVAGFATYETTLVQIGAALSAAAIGLYAMTLAGIVRGASDSGIVISYVWAALASIAVAAGAGVALALDHDLAFLPDHAATAAGHALLAGYGFMGMLALGLGHVVIPLFAVALSSEQRWSEPAFWLAAGAVALCVAGLWFDADAAAAGAVVIGLIAAGLHVWTMADLLRQRMRRRLSAEFVLIRTSWALLPVSIVLGGLLLVDLLPATGAALFGFVLLYGWLLTYLLGVLQRILPILGAMHIGRHSRTPAAPTQLVDERPLKVHRWCHLAALPLVAAGIAVDLPWLCRAGAAIGVVGAAAFAVFMAIVVRRMRMHTALAGAPAGAGA
jgi:hypothetical protein